MTDPTDPGGMRHAGRAPDEPVTLAGFAAARLDEFEAAIGTEPATGADYCDDMNGIHLDSARALREVEADRKLLARWNEADSRRTVSAEDEARAWLLDGILADRAAVWSDHPEFGKGWLT